MLICFRFSLQEYTLNRSLDSKPLWSIFEMTLFTTYLQLNGNYGSYHPITSYEKTSDTHLLYCQYLSWAAFLGQSQAKPFEPICQVAVVAISPFSPSLPKAEPWEISAFVLLMVNTFLTVFQKKLFSQGHSVLTTNNSNWTNFNISDFFNSYK